MKQSKYAVSLVVILVANILQGQTPVSSTFMVGAHADANQNDGDFHEQILTFSQGATLNPYSATAHAHDNDLVNAGKSVDVTSTASASWLSSGEGTVTWRNMGWTHNTAAQTAVKLNSFSLPVWSYTFIATTSGTFTLDYNVRGTGNKFGLLGAVIDWSGTGGGLNLINAYDPAAAGTFTRAVNAGSSYTVSLSNWGNKFTSIDPVTDSGMMDADFSWRLTSPVPEPASVAALLLGAAGLVRNRSRKRYI